MNLGNGTNNGGEFEGRLLRELSKINDKLDGLTEAVQKVSDDQLIDRQERARYRRRTKHAEQFLQQMTSSRDDLPTFEVDPAEITGTHQLREIQKKLEEDEKRRTDSGIWWKRQRWTMFFAALGAVTFLLLSTIVGTCAAYVAPKVFAPTPPPQAAAPK